jgi:dipeptidyl aminopeptidase/acylaminoacyl peptidase
MRAGGPMKHSSALLLALAFPALAIGQTESDYRTPPPEIIAAVDVPAPPQVSLSPDGKWILLLQGPAMLTIDDLSQPELKLAGVRFNPERHDQSRLPYAHSLSLVRIADGTSRPVNGLPASPRVRFASWAGDSSAVAFVVSTPAGAELWVLDPATSAARRVSTRFLNQSLPRRSFEWLSDSRTLLARVVPLNGGAAPDPPRAPSGPEIQESRGRKAPARTYEDMLRNESDAALFEHHMQSELALIPLEGEPRVVVPASMMIRATSSPDARFILTETIRRPFSYRVPFERFPRRIEIRTATGDLVRPLADLPLADQVPTDFDAVRTGPRAVDWRSDKPATLFWVEAQDEGDPRKEAAIRDRLFTLAGPFTGQAATLLDLPMRYRDLAWGHDDLVLVDSRRWRDRRQQVWRIRRDGKASILFDRSYEDRYSDPGTALTRTNSAGKEVLEIASDGRSVFLKGDGIAPDGVRPFLDRFDVDSKKATRLFRSEPPYYEVPLDLAGDAILIQRESVTEPANVFLRDRQGLRALTAIKNPAPQLSNLKKEVIRYKRADGVDLNGTLYLPASYDPQKDGPLPVLMWAYPREFTTTAAASQVTTSPYRFIRATGTGSPIFFALRGYAVLDNPTIPIVGENGREPNDTYVDQLVAGAKAAVDELVRRGVGDRDRMAIGGHSYGAFMTANLLAHSDLFRAGIARSGAYNRTLTPFSFQAEQRTFWEAPETYSVMSPFMHANKIKEPILLIHGVEDDNTGTFPIQSERLYAALSGLGGTTRLVMLPKEAHGYRARESVMHMLWEMDEWLERYVKRPQNPASSRM